MNSVFQTIKSRLFVSMTAYWLLSMHGLVFMQKGSPLIIIFVGFTLVYIVEAVKLIKQKHKDI